MIPVTPVGRLTADPEVKTSKQGNQYASFGLAVNEGFGNNQTTTFLQCRIHGEEQVQRMIKAGVKKGSFIFIIGKLEIEEYVKKDQTKGKAENVKILDWSYISSSSKSNGDNAPANDTNSAQSPADTNGGYEELECNDDDLPL